MRHLLYKLLAWLCMKVTPEPEIITIPVDVNGEPILHDDIAGKYRVFVVQFQRPISLRKFIILHKGAEFPSARYQCHEELWWKDK